MMPLISLRTALVPAIALFALAPLHAQDAAAPAAEEPETQQLNNEVQGNIEATKVVNATAQGQYAIDMAQYRADVEAHNRAVRRNARRYDRQQRAYADAMSAWRLQVDACKKGNNRACKMPTPNPADFY